MRFPIIGSTILKVWLRQLGSIKLRKLSQRITPGSNLALKVQLEFQSRNLCAVENNLWKCLEPNAKQFRLL